MPAPVVTVLLPARGAESTVARAVESLLEGPLRELRVLAVDDGSTDRTRLDGAGQGLAAALQLALSQATSPYVARLEMARALRAHGVSVEALDPPGAGMLLVCVGVRWAREELRSTLAPHEQVIPCGR